jgi:hypothetical protein
MFVFDRFNEIIGDKKQENHDVIAASSKQSNSGYMTKNNLLRKRRKIAKS